MTRTTATSHLTLASRLILQARAHRQRWNLPAASFDVLIAMCAAAGPEQDPMYWDGFVPLALTLGYDAPADEDDLSNPARQAVRTAVRDLKATGLIGCPPAGDEGEPSEGYVYFLTLLDEDTSDDGRNAEDARTAE